MKDREGRGGYHDDPAGGENAGRDRWRRDMKYKEQPLGPGDMERDGGGERGVVDVIDGGGSDDDEIRKATSLITSPA